MVEGVDIASSGAVVKVTVDRGPDNLLTVEDCFTLLACLLDPPEDARVLRLSARGAAFCLGRERRAVTIPDMRREVEALIDLNEAFSTTSLTTIAEVQGDAAGYGVGLAALCDVAIAAPSARFWFPEIDLGLPPTVVLAWLPRMVGRRAAFLLTATGEKVTAAEAAVLGLISRSAATDDSLAAEVDAIEEALLAADRGVLREIRRFLNDTSGMSTAQAYAVATDRLVVDSLYLRAAQPNSLR